MARPRTINLIGQNFGNLTVIKHDSERIAHSQQRRSFWLCQCSCGNITSVRGESLRKGHTKSCGCLAIQKVKGPQCSNFKGYGEIPLTLYCYLKQREKKNKIPVTVSIRDLWELFLKQDRKCALSGRELKFGSLSLGRKETSASLDRIDSSKGYSLDNIQWVHKDVNMMKHKYSQAYFIDTCKQITDNMRLNEST